MKLNNPMKNPETAEKVRLSNIGRTPWNKGSKTPSEVCEKLEDATESMWGYNSPDNEGWGVVSRYLEKHLQDNFWK